MMSLIPLALYAFTETVWYHLRVTARVNAANAHCDIQYVFHLTRRQVAPEPPAQSQYGHTQD